MGLKEKKGGRKGTTKRTFSQTKTALKQEKTSIQGGETEKKKKNRKRKNGSERFSTVSSRGLFFSRWRRSVGKTAGSGKRKKKGSTRSEERGPFFLQRPNKMIREAGMNGE